MKELEFYKCEDCDYVRVEFADESPCLGNSMMMLIPNTKEASEEKHIPVVTFEGDMLKVEVGSTMHPMEEKHYISGIYVVCDNGMVIQKELKPNDTPSITFKVDDANEVDVYAVCNLHGLWKNNAKR